MRRKMIRCKFREGENIKLPIKSSSYIHAKTIGFLESYNCVDLTFYCEYDNIVDETGRPPIESGFFRLVSPNKYNIQNVQTGYIDIIRAVCLGYIKSNDIIEMSETDIVDVCTL